MTEFHYLADMNVLYQRWDESANQTRLDTERSELGMPRHVAPFSCMIAAIGNHWEPGCYEAVAAMAQYTFQQGFQVCLYEEHDRCYNPYDALGSMRNMAYQRAISCGYEYLCYVDNDIKPPPDALVRLARRWVPVVAPITTYVDQQAHGLKVPLVQPGQGLAMISSCVLSMLLFQTRVFLPWALTPFWENAIGADEEYHFRRLEMTGHRLWLDTDVVVEVTKPPSYPLDRRPAR